MDLKEIKEKIVMDSMRITNPSFRGLVSYVFEMGFGIAQHSRLIDALKEIEFLIANDQACAAYVLAQETINSYEIKRTT